MKINMKNVASYGEGTPPLETEKKINLIYGFNGTGKTTLSDFLYFHKNEEKREFKDCTLEGVGDEKILVYNQSFIRDNFYDKDTLNGIFTLSRENREAEEAIKKREEEKEMLREEKRKKEANKGELEDKRNTELEKIRDEVWEIKRQYTGGDRILEFCLEGLKSDKKKLFDHIKGTKKSEEQTSKTIEELKSEAQSTIGKNAQKYKEITSIELNVRDIESNDIYSQMIIGDEGSPVAELINKLQNSDWVKQGLGYLPNDTGGDAEQCPFCQQKTITEHVTNHIRAYFDETYEQKIGEIKRLKEQYEQEKLPPIENYRDHPMIKENLDTFENLYNQLQQSLQQNLSQMGTKLNNPSQGIEIHSTEHKLTELNNNLSEIRQRVQDHNLKIENEEQTKEKIKNEFWQIMREKYNDKIDQYEKEDKELNCKIEKIQAEIKNIEDKINKCDDDIQAHQKSTVNIDGAIENINKGLNELGIEGFSIEKHKDKLYRIVRQGHQENQFLTLSESEKMIISFLYFMELCKGKESQEETEAEKIIVIDDPISSLSHAYIFHLAIWIRDHFFNNTYYKKVFVLTHSLYFFHELIRDDAKDKQLFRLTKSPSNETQIDPMEKSEIQNEYQSYWQVIKDHQDGKASDALLANCMRNILEHFFGFISKSKWKEELQSLGNKFEPFIRYMNRESHSDAINITDSKEIDHELFKRAFKKVFAETEHEKHYNEMMGTEPTNTGSS